MYFVAFKAGSVQQTKKRALAGIIKAVACKVDMRYLFSLKKKSYDIRIFTIKKNM